MYGLVSPDDNEVIRGAGKKNVTAVRADNGSNGVAADGIGGGLTGVRNGEQLRWLSGAGAAENKPKAGEIDKAMDEDPFHK